MAMCLSRFVFPNRGEFEKAKLALCNQMVKDAHDPNCIRFESTGISQVICVMERCSDPRMVASICRGYHGIFQDRMR